MPESLNAEKQSSIRWVLVSDENLRKVKLSLTQIGEKNIFSFPGSRYFFDYLSREGPGGVEKYLSLHEKSSWKKSIVIINHANRKKANQLENVLRKAELARDNESKTKISKTSKSNIISYSPILPHRKMRNITNPCKSTWNITTHHESQTTNWGNTIKYERASTNKFDDEYISENTK